MLKMRHARGKSDFVFLGLVLGLVFFGLMMLWSASAPLAYGRFGSNTYFVRHQLFFGVLPGLAAMFIAMRIPYQIWKRLALPLMIASIALLIAVFIPGIRAEFGTARSWIQIGGFSFQPSEIIKLTFLFYLAAWLESRGEQVVRGLRTGLIPFLILVGLVVGLLIAEPDTGTMAIIVLEALVVYFVAGAPLRYLFLMGGAGLVLLVALVKLSPYRAARLMTFIHPELDPQGIGYHVNQALLAVGSGGFFGLGLGHSRQKFEYLPEVHSDSIFAIMGEELGFVVTALFIVALVVLLRRGLRIALRAPDQFGKFVSMGVLAWIVIQSFVNIGAMVGILPLTGVPLPFISYGGTAMVMTLTGVGVLLNISRNA